MSRAKTEKNAERPESDLPFFAGGGEMGERMRRMDWARTVLGPAEAWPQSLRTAVSICLNCRFPIILFWGQRFTHLYNDEYRAVLGAKHPALGKDGREVWPEIWDTVGPMMTQVMATGEATRARDLLLRIARGEGARIEDCYFSFSYSPVIDEEGRVAGVFCPVIETTETVKAQRRLEDEGGRLKSLFRQSPSFMAVLEGPEHVFVLANESYEDTFGPRPLIGLTVRQAFPELEGQGYFEALDEVFATGRPSVHRSARVQIRWQGGDGLEERFIEYLFQPILDARGSVSGIFVQGNDITERTQGERRDAFLVRFDDRTRSLSDPEEIAFQGMRLLCEELGADRATYFEVDHAAQVGTVLRDYAPGIVGLAGRTLAIDDYGATFGAAMRANRTLVLNDVEEAGLTPEERQRFEEIGIGAVVIAPLHKDGELIAMVGIYQGNARRWQPHEIELVHLVINRCWEAIGRARIARELREGDRRKDEFIATLAHELRNPLAPLRNGLAVLRRGAPGIPTERLFGMMERQVDHLVHMVDDLLDVSRISRGKIEIRPRILDLVEPVRNALETARPWVESARHHLTVKLPGPPILVRGDVVRLTQIFANLLNNACKYTANEGRIAVTVEAEPGAAVVTIADDGIGIEPEMRGRIFEMFAQIPDDGQRSDGGLGIGLSLVRSLVELHGGTVSVHSDGRGKGSRFEVRLPVAATGTISSAAPRPGLAGNGTTRRVLVVDDNRDSADSLALVLTIIGADVRVAYDGARALQLVEEYRPSIALLDLGMPGMDGHELARRIRHGAGGREVQLVALTGWGQKDDREETQRAGFARHLVKPVTIEVLQEVLEDLSSSGMGSV